MAWNDQTRFERRFDSAVPDSRLAFERDRDRILYSSAFRRLAGISQIVRAGEADVFHTRLIHSYKVAQIGRRLAQRMVAEQAPEAQELGVHPEVVEAACLAHDLGHPPFGHTGEEKLCELVDQHGTGREGGYEGNAQAFRIVTKLAIRFEDQDGLDLTRATLAAILKYPWIRDRKKPARSKKFSAYPTERDAYRWVTKFLPKETRSAEAELMDWADDIAYSVHDLEDLHRCRLVPWHLLLDRQSGYREKLVRNAEDQWKPDKPRDCRDRLGASLDRLLDKLLKPAVPQLLHTLYVASKEQRQQLRFITSWLIGRYIGCIELQPSGPRSVSLRRNATLDPEAEVRILKQITRDYMIRDPALAAQQRGYQKVVEELFEDLLEDVKGARRYFPGKFVHLLDDHPSPARSVADCISGLTEAEAVALNARLRGRSSGSVLDPIIR